MAAVNDYENPRTLPNMANLHIMMTSPKRKLIVTSNKGLSLTKAINAEQLHGVKLTKLEDDEGMIDNNDIERASVITDDLPITPRDF